MRFVSFLVFVSRGDCHEQMAFASKRTVASGRGLTVATQFWADAPSEHRLDVIHEPPEGPERLLASITVSAEASGPLAREVALPPLESAGSHRLHLELDGKRLSSPIVAQVREALRRGPRSRYKGRGALVADPAHGWPRELFTSRPSVARPPTGGCLRHGEVFPLDRVADSDGALSGLWVAAYFAGFSAGERGPHMFSVIDTRPDGTQATLAVNYFEVADDRVTMTLRLDPVGGSGAHRLDVAVDGRPVGALGLMV